MILPFYSQLYFYTFSYHRKYYNRYCAAWPQHRLAQLVDPKFLIFHQFLDCILLDFQDHCTALCIYGPVMSNHLRVLAIYQSACGYLQHLHPNVSCQFCSFSLVVFQLIIGQELKNRHSESLDLIYLEHNLQLFSVNFYHVKLQNLNICPSQKSFWPYMVGHDVQTHQEQYQLLYRLRLPQGQADLVSLLYKCKLFIPHSAQVHQNISLPLLAVL